MKTATTEKKHEPTSRNHHQNEKKNTLTHAQLQIEWKTYEPKQFRCVRNEKKRRKNSNSHNYMDT